MNTSLVSIALPGAAAANKPGARHTDTDRAREADGFAGLFAGQIHAHSPAASMTAYGTTTPSTAHTPSAGRTGRTSGANPAASESPLARQAHHHARAVHGMHSHVATTDQDGSGHGGRLMPAGRDHAAGMLDADPAARAAQGKRGMPGLLSTDANAAAHTAASAAGREEHSQRLIGAKPGVHDAVGPDASKAASNTLNPFAQGVVSHKPPIDGAHMPGHFLHIQRALSHDMSAQRTAAAYPEPNSRTRASQGTGKTLAVDATRAKTSAAGAKASTVHTHDKHDSTRTTKRTGLAAVAGMPAASGAGSHAAAPEGLRPANSQGGARMHTAETADATTAYAPALHAFATAGTLTQPPEGGAPALPLSPSPQLYDPEWRSELGRQFVSMLPHAKNGPHSAELRLDPPELGPLRITLNINDSVVQAVFTSAHAAVRTAVEHALPQLQQQLAQEGLSLGQTSVGHDSQSSSFLSHEEQRSVNESALRHSNDEGDGPHRLAQANPAAIASSRRHDGLVDTFA